MIRTLSVLVMLAVATEASAQTAPTRTTTTRSATAKNQRTTVQKTTKKGMGAANTTARPAPAAGSRTDIGPAGNGAVGSTESADGKGQNTYAAPGMPVNVDNPKKVEGYNGPAPVRPRSGTTLTPR